MSEGARGIDVRVEEDEVEANNVLHQRVGPVALTEKDSTGQRKRVSHQNHSVSNVTAPICKLRHAIQYANIE